jgi:hypothetical protein
VTGCCACWSRPRTSQAARLGVGGLALTLTGPAGAYWPYVIGGLYAAGVAALLEPGGPAETVARDPEGMHVLARAIRQDVPEPVGATYGPAGVQGQRAAPGA